MVKHGPNQAHVAKGAAEPPVNTATQRVDPVPKTPVPTPPPGSVKMANPPLIIQAAAGEAGAASEEVRNATNYKGLGDAAPDQGATADALGLLASWFVILKATEVWHAYVTDQVRRAVANAERVAGPLRAPLEALVARQPQAAEAFSALLAFFHATNDRAERAAETRKRTQRQKRAAAKVPPQTPPTNGSHGTG